MNFLAPKAPPVTPPATLPDPESPGVMEARRKAAEDIMSRSGRRSTILTTPESRNGTGESYANSTLGGGA